MSPTRSVTWLALGVLAVALAGCSGDDAKAKRDRRMAANFSVAVERVTNAVEREASDALTMLNGVVDGSLKPHRASVVLDRRAAAVQADAERLAPARLMAPVSARSARGSLESEIGELARNIRTVATDLRVAPRNHANVHDAAIAGGRLVLAGSSGISSLSLALRELSTPR